MIEIDDAVTSSAVIAEPKSSFTALNWNQRSISIPKGFILGADQGPSQGRDSSDPQQGGFDDSVAGKQSRARATNGF